LNRQSILIEREAQALLFFIIADSRFGSGTLDPGRELDGPEAADLFPAE